MKIIIPVCIFLSFFWSYGQDLEKHKWQNRIVLLLTDDIRSEFFQKQINTFKEDQKGLDERKLIVYKVVSLDGKLLGNGDNWINNQEIFNKYKKTRGVTEIVLLGLDGDVKLRQSKHLSLEKLFTIIDGMPMRKSEIESKFK